MLMSDNLDKTDKLILKELQKDSSISNLELSKRVGLSPSACLGRTKSLVKSGIIKRFATIVDEKKLGMEVTAFVLVNLSPLNRKTIHAFLEKVNNFPQILECYTLTGNNDFLLKIVAKDMDYYRDFIIDSLMQDASISKVETSIVMCTEKRKIAIPIDDL